MIIPMLFASAELKRAGLGSRVSILQSELPIVYANTGTAARISPWGRLLAASIALGCLSLLVVAAFLPPSPDGLGTHTQLGLQQCGFLQRTGLPCPSCGMTTSFAWFVRGNILASFYVQPMGMILALLCGMTVWTGAYVAITGRPVYRLVSTLPPKYYLFPLLVLALIAWAWKIFIHLHGMDGWG
jgi:hypothetical protein